MAEVVINDQEGTAKWSRNPWEQFREGFYRAAEDRPYQLGASAVEHIVHDSAANPRNWKQAYEVPDRQLTVAERIGATMGLAVRDLMRDGSRIPYWALNHPLAITSVVADIAGKTAGLQPDYAALEKHAEANDLPAGRGDLNKRWEEHMGFDRARIPLVLAGKMIPFLAATGLVQASGNHDLLNPLEGGRPRGFQAVIPKEDDPTQTANLPGEMISRYLFGRTGRLLPWEQFTQERPDVSPEDYGSYKRHQFDKGLLNIGLVKGTSRNIEGEPEFTMMGFRTPLSGIGTAGGAMIGGHLGAHMAAGPETVGDVTGHTKAFPGGRHQGPRRLAGAIAGALAGSVAGNLSTRAANDLVLQPLINPEAVEAERVWREQQRAAGVL